MPPGRAPAPANVVFTFNNTTPLPVLVWAGAPAVVLDKVCIGAGQSRTVQAVTSATYEVVALTMRDAQCQQAIGGPTNAFYARPVNGRVTVSYVPAYTMEQLERR